MPDLFILAGCNGAGKTTASKIVLPELWKCKEFVNADSIAAALCPADPDSVAIEAGRLMIGRVDQLLEEGADFSIETTLSTRSYISLIKRAREKGYTITLLFFWLASPEMAIDRVASRVSKGGHNIPEAIIRRRYGRGIQNLTGLYTGICNSWIIVNNTNSDPEIIAEGRFTKPTAVWDERIWEMIAQQKRGFDMVGEQELPYRSAYAEKVRQCIKKAIVIMLREAAIKNETVVVGDSEGNFREVPARELLDEADQVFRSS